MRALLAAAVVGLLLAPAAGFAGAAAPGRRLPPLGSSERLAPLGRVTRPAPGVRAGRAAPRPDAQGWPEVRRRLEGAVHDPKLRSALRQHRGKIDFATKPVDEGRFHPGEATLRLSAKGLYIHTEFPSKVGAGKRKRVPAGFDGAHRILGKVLEPHEWPMLTAHGIEAAIAEFWRSPRGEP